MNAKCFHCDLIREGRPITQTPHAGAFLHVLPAAIGHTIIVPKEHHTILEQVPDELLKHLADFTNTVQTICMHGLAALGTNIIINNGVGAGQQNTHFIIHIIPRKPNDKLPFGWPPHQTNEQQMYEIENGLKEMLQHNRKEARTEAIEQLKEQKEHQADYPSQVQHMTRIP